MNRKDPNIAVELWKDEVYKETKGLSGKDLDHWFTKKTEDVLKSHRLTFVTKRGKR